MAEGTVTTPKGPPIMSAKDIPDKNGVNMYIFAYPKVGKTTFACTAQDSPYGKDVLLIDCGADAGVRSISHRDDIDVIQIHEWDQLGKMYDHLLVADHSYRTIIIDPVSTAQDLARIVVSKDSKTPLAPSYDDWNKLNWMTLTMMRDFKNLASERGWNVLFIDWAKEEKDEATGRLIQRPMVTPSVGQKLGGAVDIIAYMSIDRDRNRTLDFEPNFLSVTGKRESPVLAGKLPDKLVGVDGVGPTMVEVLEYVQPLQKAEKRK